MALGRLLADRGLDEMQIENGLEYAGHSGAGTMREGFELAMSRAIFSDAELAAGRRYDASEHAEPAG